MSVPKQIISLYTAVQGGRHSEGSHNKGCWFGVTHWSRLKGSEHLHHPIHHPSTPNPPFLPRRLLRRQTRPTRTRAKDHQRPCRASLANVRQRRPHRSLPLGHQGDGRSGANLLRHYERWAAIAEGDESAWPEVERGGEEERDAGELWWYDRDVARGDRGNGLVVDTDVDLLFVGLFRDLKALCSFLLLLFENMMNYGSWNADFILPFGVISMQRKILWTNAQNTICCLTTVRGFRRRFVMRLQRMVVSWRLEISVLAAGIDWALV